MLLGEVPRNVNLGPVLIPEGACVLEKIEKVVGPWFFGDPVETWILRESEDFRGSLPSVEICERPRYSSFAVCLEMFGQPEALVFPENRGRHPWFFGESTWNGGRSEEIVSNGPACQFHEVSRNEKRESFCVEERARMIGDREDVRHCLWCLTDTEASSRRQIKSALGGLM